MQKVKGDVTAFFPLVSVLMSVHNGERYLSQAIESILKQSFADFEFIIIDDGSADTSWEILTNAAARDNRIKLIRNGSNLGLSKSLNRGISLAKGAFIARQDADDVSHPERLATQLALFVETPGLVLIGSAYWVINENDQVLRIDHQPIDDTSIRWQMLFHNSFAHSSVMVRAGVLATNRLSYNEECRYAQDYELWSHLLDHGSALNCEEPLISYRLHDSSQRVAAYREQQAIATCIAMKNVGKLGLQINKQQMDNLRDLYHGRLTANRLKGVHNYRLLVQILSKFARCMPVNQFKLAVIRLRLFMEIFRLKRSGVSIREMAHLEWAIFTIDAPTFILAACSVALGKLGKYLQIRLYL